MAYPGQTVALTAEFLDSPTGPLVDTPDLTITITDPLGVVEVDQTSVGIVHVSTGVYRYTWTIPADAAEGDHVALWVGDSGSVTATELITVTALDAGAWCTVADVALLTGATVTIATVVQASAQIELHTGRTYLELVAEPDGGTVKIGRRDREWLRRACAYQAAWLLGQPDMHRRMQITNSTTPGGASVTLGAKALELAPLARAALKRVSWVRTRSLHVRSPFTDSAAGISPDATAEVNDAYQAWAAMT
jgi:hypothetical protein